MRQLNFLPKIHNLLYASGASLLLFIGMQEVKMIGVYIRATKMMVYCRASPCHIALYHATIAVSCHNVATYTSLCLMRILQDAPKSRL